MPPHWQGYKALCQGRVRVDFEDITNLLHNFTVTSDAEISRLKASHDEGTASKVVIIKRVHGLGQWGAALQEIAGSDSTSMREKCKLVGQLCWRIFCAVRFGQAAAQGIAPWEDEHAAVWQDQDQCPGLCKKGNAPADMRGSVCEGRGSGEYASVILGKQYCEVFGAAEASCYSAPVYFYLHRFACWLGNGSHGQQDQLATHGCGIKGCLKLGCLTWGDCQSNSEEYWEAVRSGRKKRKRR